MYFCRLFLKMNKGYIICMKYLYTLLFLCLGIGVGVAQTTVTIEQCQQWAVSQTSANVQKDLNGQILRTNLNNAAAHLFPKLSVNGRLGYQSGDTPDFFLLENADQWSSLQYHIGVDFEQVVFEGGKMFYGREYATLQNDAEIYKIELVMNEVKAKVISLYLNLLILDKQMGILENVKSTFNDQIKQLQVLYKEGVIPQNNLSQLELEALKLDQNYDELSAKKGSVISTLSILTGQDLQNADFVMPALDDFTADETSGRLEYAIYDNQIKQMDFQRKLHFSSSLPKISLFATAGYGRPDYQFFYNRPDWYYMAGVYLKIPVIDWAKSSGIGKVINIQKQILKSQEEDFKKSNQIAIKDKLNEIRRLEHLLVLDKAITAKYASLTKTYSSQLANGTITITDYIRQYNDELQSLMNQEIHNIQLLKAKYEMLALRGQL